jgi:hypothetical protein
LSADGNSQHGARANMKQGNWLKFWKRRYPLYADGDSQNGARAIMKRELAQVLVEAGTPCMLTGILNMGYALTSSWNRLKF